MAKNKQKRFKPKYKIKKGDKVVVVAGSYKNRDKVRNVLEVLPDKGRIIVEDVNIVKKHVKPTQDSAGGIQEKAAPIDISNVMLVDPKTGEPTRVGRKVVDGKVVRYAKKSGEIIK
ncbi:MAG: 50S ribosomal protein L24 [Saprospirales bacterium]|jgi:large subunit ribosomal protein L24|nr:MAG: 50S ribosomal protein L24 [Saprospirales bacterium]